LADRDRALMRRREDDVELVQFGRGFPPAWPKWLPVIKIRQRR
jgi:hypothetical protein